MNDEMQAWQAKGWRAILSGVQAAARTLSSEKLHPRHLNESLNSLSRPFSRVWN